MNEKMKTLSDELLSLKESKSKLNEEIKFFNSRIKEIETELMAMMEEEELELFRTESGTFSLKTSMYAGIENMSDFINWIQKTENIGFIQKRASNKAIEEYFNETGILPPGISTYLKTTISTRKK